MYYYLPYYLYIKLLIDFKSLCLYRDNTLAFKIIPSVLTSPSEVLTLTIQCYIYNSPITTPAIQKSFNNPSFPNPDSIEFLDLEVSSIGTDIHDNSNELIRIKVAPEERIVLLFEKILEILSIKKLELKQE